MAKEYAPKITSNRGHTVKIRNIDLYYETYGVGQPLLLLHGFGGCSQNWLPFSDKLSENHKLIIVDLRGHGHSSNPDNKFTHREAAQDVFLLLEKLGINQFSAMGMSTGGMILLHMATSRPSQIESMVLISSTYYFPKQARTIMGRASFETLPKEVKDMYQECAKHGEEQIRQLIKQFNAFQENDDDMNFNEQNLSTITARTLIVHGDRDPFFPVDIALSIYRSIPNSALWVIPYGYHVPIYDSIIEFLSITLDFIDGQWVRQINI